jgi:dihydrodipicolinate reductase
MAITAALNKVYDISVNPAFVNRIAAALLDQVATVAGEAGATTDHANRLSFAANVAYMPLHWAQIMAFGCVVTNANIQNALTAATSDANNLLVADADIKVAVGVVWNFYADSVFTLQTNKAL